MAALNTTKTSTPRRPLNGSYLKCFEVFAMNAYPEFNVFDKETKRQIYRLNTAETALTSKLKFELPHFDRLQTSISKEIDALPTTGFGKNPQADPLRNRLLQYTADANTYTTERQKLVERMEQFSRIKKTSIAEICQWKREGRSPRSIDERLDQLRKQYQTISADTERLLINEKNVLNNLLTLQHETHQALVNANASYLLSGKPYLPGST
jgi:hypothetical protein